MAGPAGGGLSGGAAVVGWRAQWANLAVGAEAAGGVRAVVAHVSSQLGACETSDSTAAWAPVLELRGVAAYRVMPEVAIAARGGRSLVDDGWLVGLAVEVDAFE